MFFLVFSANTALFAVLTADLESKNMKNDEKLFINIIDDNDQYR